MVKISYAYALCCYQSIQFSVKSAILELTVSFICISLNYSFYLRTEREIPGQN